MGVEVSGFIEFIKSLGCIIHEGENSNGKTVMEKVAEFIIEAGRLDHSNSVQSVFYSPPEPACRCSSRYATQPPYY